MINPDNSPAKKTEYGQRIKLMTDQELFDEAKLKIWLSAFASNNPNSCYHWQCDAVYDECKQRNKVNEIYQKAYNENISSVSADTE